MQENVLESDEIVIVRSAIPGRVAIGMCSPASPGLGKGIRPPPRLLLTTARNVHGRTRELEVRVRLDDAVEDLHRVVGRRRARRQARELRSPGTLTSNPRARAREFLDDPRVSATGPGKAASYDWREP